MATHRRRLEMPWNVALEFDIFLLAAVAVVKDDRAS